MIGIGTRWSDFTTASKTAFQDAGVRFVNVNVCAFDAAKHAGLQLVGDARVTLEALGAALGDAHAPTPAWTARAEAERAAWARGGRARGRRRAAGAPLTQAAVIGAVNDAAGTTGVVVQAAGSLPGDLHKLWVARDPAGKGYHVEYGYSCMGYELPGAIGVKLAAPEREVYALVGDGSYLMSPGELATAVALRARIVVVLIQNHGYASIGALSRSVGGAGFGTHHRVPEDGDAAAPVLDDAGRRRARGARARAARRPRRQRREPRRPGHARRLARRAARRAGRRARRRRPGRDPRRGRPLPHRRRLRELVGRPRRRRLGPPGGRRGPRALRARARARSARTSAPHEHHPATPRRRRLDRRHPGVGRLDLRRLRGRAPGARRHGRARDRRPRGLRRRGLRHDPRAQRARRVARPRRPARPVLGPARGGLPAARRRPTSSRARAATAPRSASAPRPPSAAPRRGRCARPTPRSSGAATTPTSASSATS